MGIQNIKNRLAKLEMTIKQGKEQKAFQKFNKLFRKFINKEQFVGAELKEWKYFKESKSTPLTKFFTELLENTSTLNNIPSLQKGGTNV